LIKKKIASKKRRKICLQTKTYQLQSRKKTPHKKTMVRKKSVANFYFRLTLRRIAAICLESVWREH